jgi:hypothetical protein
MLNPTDHLEPNLDRAAGEVIDGEAIIINLVTGVYYSMQGIGGAIWSMIDACRSVGSMLDEIVATYDVPAGDASADLHSVLGQLLEEGLVQVTDDQVTYGGQDAPASSTPAAKQPYQRPLLQVYRDMQDLLALDPPAPGMNRIAWNDRDPVSK